jgi:signal transduction histidine kinase
MVFSAVFAGTYYWFYTFSTEKAILRLQSTIEDTLTGTAQGIDVDELISLYEDGENIPEPFPNDSRYINQLEWFETVHQIEPSIWLYTYVLVPVDQDITDQGLVVGDRFTSSNYEDRENLSADYWGLVYLVDLWASTDPSKAAGFREFAFPAGSAARQALFEGRMVHEPNIYTDDWGTWMSAFVPLYSSDGTVVAGLGLDIEANYVFEIQQAIRNRVLLSFGVTYSVLFTLIYVLSGILTRRLAELTISAEQISAGNYTLPMPLFAARSTFVPDEMDRLAQVFETMVESIRVREQTIREGKQIEDEIRHALQEEKEMNELKSRFVSMVSHELRTPLTIIRTSSELLEKYGSTISQEKRLLYFQRIHTAVSQMTQLLEDVLTFGRAEAGRLDFQPISMNLKEFCHEIIEEIRMGLGRHHAIFFEVEGQVEETWIDPTLMRSILTNLLSNAVKYSPGGSKVTCRLNYQDDWTTLQVSDRGIGIPTDDQARLFELFHRARNTTNIRGTGIGLAIVKQCVDRHRGTIRFASQEGEGTTFTIQLPPTSKEFLGDRS